jgi:hypothetical protein
MSEFQLQRISWEDFSQEELSRFAAGMIDDVTTEQARSMTKAELVRLLDNQDPRD